MSLNRCVDVFFGCGAVNLPSPEGVAARWHPFKGKAGNTTPAAARPFGKLTACAYSGGYSAGYGELDTNSGDWPRVIMPAGTIRGFSHIHHSGAGYIASFYNYTVVAPYMSGPPEEAFSPELMEQESACPGYYAVSMRGVRCELTVSDQAAHHRYTFPQEGGRLAIDFTNNGLLPDRTHWEYKDLSLRITAPDTVECCVTLQNVKMHFCARCPGARAELWDKGCVFYTDEQTVRLTMGISCRDMEIARAGAAECLWDFDEITAESARQWEEALRAIEVETADEREKRLFYSCFYHTIVKPNDWHGESFMYDDEDAFMVDFATLWDQYKTQLPLVLTLYPDVSDKIVRTLIAYGRAKGRMPVFILMEDGNTSRMDDQACMLGEHVLADAMYRGVPMDLKEAVRSIRKDVMPPERFAQYKAKGIATAVGQTIDIADGCNATAEMARRAGDMELATFCEELAKKWPAAFDTETGLLDPNSKFYEGDHWNYSFRLMHDMPTRLAIAGGKERYAELLDCFFGFTEERARFEGFNNETDMETPYAYYYAGRHDRLCEVIHSGMQSVFAEGRGGLPGNNDSGGLTSLYMWNAMGIFPVSGQDLMLIGSPSLRSACMHMANGKDFTIRREGEGIYVAKAVLNGRVLEELSFSVTEMMQGGELILSMSSTAK